MTFHSNVQLIAHRLDEPPSFLLTNIFSDQSLLYFLLTAVFLSFTTWASAIEAAFFSLHHDDVDRFRASNDLREKKVALLLEKPRLLLLSLTTCKYLSVVGAAVLAVSTFTFQADFLNLHEFSLGFFVLLITVTFSLIGVILGKIFGSTNNIILARSNSGISQGLVRIFRPLVKPLLRTSVRVESKLNLSTERKSEEELTQALQLAIADNEPIEGEKEILEGIVSFGTLSVKQVMRPVTEISFADISFDFFQLMEFVNRSGYSRVPVCRGTLESVEGFLYIKDLLPFLEQTSTFPWQKLLRPLYFVSDTKKIDLLLKEFQEKRVHMALVKNQLDKTVGLITMEDIIEEFIGDINDEFDEPGIRYQKISDRVYLFDAKSSLYEFCKVLNIDPAIFQPIKGINESLSALLKEVNEGLPFVGDKIEIDRFTFVIESVDHKRIKKIRVELAE
jgi:putative hemolysin